MKNNQLISGDNGVNGVFRCKLVHGLDESDIRVYVPGVSSINPFNSDGTVNMEAYNSNKDSFPKVQWCCYNVDSTEFNNQDPLNWCMFENGDFRKPVVISYAVIGESYKGEESSSETSNDADSNGSGASDNIDTSVDSTSDTSNSSKESYSGSDVIEKAISAWENDCKGKSYGRGANQYDCSSSTSHAFMKAGVLSTDTYTTHTAVSAYTSAGFVDVTNSVGTGSYNNLQRGDVLWSSGHMAIYLGNGRITASNSRRGNSEGNWYNFATRVFRYTN